jgi:hypothetical protein
LVQLGILATAGEYQKIGQDFVTKAAYRSFVLIAFSA